jgi:hypothetical protein
MMNAIMAIHQHALKVPEIVSVIEECERRFLLKSPFNSIAKLHLIVRNARGQLATQSSVFVRNARARLVVHVVVVRCLFVLPLRPFQDHTASGPSSRCWTGWSLAC